MDGDRGMYVRRGGRDEGRLLVLLHGLGATGAVWDGVARLADVDWPGPWLVPDLSGHGRTPAAAPYSFGRYAAEVAQLIDPDVEVVVAGHSMGGVVALALASGWFGVQVVAAVGIGIKLLWTREELAKARELAARPARVFDTLDEAAVRYLRVAGLDGLVAPSDPAAREGVGERDSGWGLAQDPATFAVGEPQVPAMLEAARCPTLLAAGEHDAMCPEDHLRAVQPDAVVLQGLGHNAHVEDPEAVLSLIRKHAG